MMRNENLYQSLLLLNTHELFGKTYFDIYKDNMNYSQLIYLSTHKITGDPMDALFEPGAMDAQVTLQESFHAKYMERGLTEQDFFHESKNIEIGKLLRYISIPKHKHGFMECAFVLNGKCTHTVYNSEYVQEKGSFIVVPSGVEHELVASDDCLCLTIKIRSSLFANLHIPNLPFFIYPVCFQCEDDPFVRNILLSMYDQQEKKLAYSDQLIEDLFQVLLTFIMQNFQDTMRVLASNTLQATKTLHIINYMFENYQTITLKALARRFHFSEAYLSTLIHQQAGNTFTHILKEFKLRRAAELLENTELELDRICESIGYKDTTQFIRSFKKQYNTTPAKYRRQAK